MAVATSEDEAGTIGLATNCGAAAAPATAAPRPRPRPRAPRPKAAPRPFPESAPSLRLQELRSLSSAASMLSATTVGCCAAVTARAAALDEAPKDDDAAPPAELASALAAVEAFTGRLRLQALSALPPALAGGLAVADEAALAHEAGGGGPAGPAEVLGAALHACLPLSASGAACGLSSV